MDRLVVALKFRLRGLKPRLVAMILAPVVTGKIQKMLWTHRMNHPRDKFITRRFGSLRLINFFQNQHQIIFFPSTSFCSAAFNLST